MPRPLDREIARLALPALVMLLAEPSYLLVDTAVVGHLGTDQLGALAVASTILLTVSSLCIFLAYGTTASVARLLGAGTQGARFRPRWVEQRRLVKVGADLALRTTALRLSLVLITVVASRIGPIELAAHQVAFEIWAFLAMGHDALAIAAQSMVGLRLGAGDRLGARAVGVRLLQMGLLASVATAVLVVVLAPVLPRVFSSDPEVVALIGFLLIWVAVLQPLGALAFVLDGILIGAGDQRFLAWAMLGAAAVFAVAVAPVLPLGLGIGWLWAAFGVLMATRVVVLGIRFRGDRWLITGARAIATNSPGHPQ